MNSRNIFNKIKEVIDFLCGKRKIINASNNFYDKGNFWSIKKHFLLYYYLNPFLNITIRQNSNPIYIDFCSGPGAIKLESGYKFLGSPIIPLLKGNYYVKGTEEFRRFKKYYFIDNSAETCSTLKRRIDEARHFLETREDKENIPEEDLFIRNGDCNEEIYNILENVDKNEKNTILAFIDPENITTIKWETLRELFSREYVDIVYAYPTKGLKRGLRADHFDEYIPYLNQKERKIALSSQKPEWYAKKFIENVLEKLKRRNEIFWDQIPVSNTKNSELYRILWASSSEGAANSIKDTIKDAKKINNKDILLAFQMLKGNQSSLRDYRETPSC